MLFSNQTQISQTSPQFNNLKYRFIVSAIAVLSLLVIFRETTFSMIHVWHTSHIFTHSYFTIPVFIWLVIRKRKELASTTLQTDYRPIILLFVAGGIWLLSALSGLRVGQHVALTIMIVLVLWSTLGSSASKVILFPILFLFSLAPVGEELVPVLMEITADMTVFAIGMTGIPIYRDGLFFSIPSGNWSVVEACSGIRYLITSLWLGSIYAYVSFQSYKRRTIFIAIALIVPIFANSIRAFAIVMIGHFSNMKLATGVDHLVYGWLFFGVVMFILFSIGNYMAEKEHSQEFQTKDNLVAIENKTESTLYQFLLLGIISITPALIIKTWHVSIENQTLSPAHTQLSPTNLLPGSTIDTRQNQAYSFTPNISGWTSMQTAAYFINSTTAENVINARAYVYENQKDGKEMINGSNTLLSSKDADWQTYQTKNVNISTSSEVNRSFKIEQSILKSNQNSIVVWKWYSVNGVFTGSKAHTKLIELKNKLLKKPTLSITYVLDTTETPQSSNQSLRQIINKLFVVKSL